MNLTITPKLLYLLRKNPVLFHLRYSTMCLILGWLHVKGQAKVNLVFEHEMHEQVWSMETIQATADVAPRSHPIITL